MAISSKLIDARLEALNKWQQVIRIKESQISEKLIRGENQNSIECEWQRKAKGMGFNHINLFCSLAAWSDNITDILTDERYDNLEYKFVWGDAKIISRYYIRFILTASEYFVDFCDIYSKIKGKKAKQKTIRNELSAKGKIALDDYLEFTNRFIKHKTTSFHKCNHHLLYAYADNKDYENSDITKNHANDTVWIGNLNTSKETRYIYLPKLIDIIEAIEYCYKQLKTALNNESIFQKICCEFETERI